jgi:hypothetical protein
MTWCSCFTIACNRRMVYGASAPRPSTPEMLSRIASRDPASLNPSPMLARSSAEWSRCRRFPTIMVRNFRRVRLSLPKIGPLEPMPAPDHGLKIFSSCPVSAQARPERCVRELQEFARASEDAGHEGALVPRVYRQQPAGSLARLANHHRIHRPSVPPW